MIGHATVVAYATGHKTEQINTGASFHSKKPPSHFAKSWEPGPENPASSGLEVILADLSNKKADRLPALAGLTDVSLSIDRSFHR